MIRRAIFLAGVLTLIGICSVLAAPPGFIGGGFVSLPPGGGGGGLTIVQTTSGDCASSAITTCASTAFGTGTTAGNLIMIGLTGCTIDCGSGGSGPIISFGDGGDTCVQVPGAIANPGGTVTLAEWWKCENISAGKTVVTLTATLIAYPQFSVYEISGAPTSGATEGGVGVIATGSPTSVSCGMVTTGANELVFADGITVGSVTPPGSPWSSPLAYGIYRSAATAGTYTATFAVSGGVDAECAGAAVK